MKHVARVSSRDVVIKHITCIIRLTTCWGIPKTKVECCRVWFNGHVELITLRVHWDIDKGQEFGQTLQPIVLHSCYRRQFPSLISKVCSCKFLEWSDLRGFLLLWGRPLSSEHCSLIHSSVEQNCRPHCIWPVISTVRRIWNQFKC